MSFPCLGSIRYGELRAEFRAVVDDVVAREKWLSENLVYVSRAPGPLPGDPEHEVWRWMGLDGNEKYLAARGPLSRQHYMSMSDCYAMLKGKEISQEIEKLNV